MENEHNYAIYLDLELELHALPKGNVSAKRKESRQKNRKSGKQMTQKRMEFMLPVEQISLFDTDSEVERRISSVVPTQRYRTP